MKTASNREKRGSGGVMRVIRRVHLYSGLLLMPWVLLFGITALSFNHPTVGRGLTGRMIPPEQLTELTGVKKVDPEELANEVTRGLSDDPLAYRLHVGSAHLSGWPLFVRPAPGGPEVVILGLDQGRAILTHRTSSKPSKVLPFSGKTVPLSSFDMQKLAQDLDPLHKKLDIPVLGSLKPHPQIHPELRFVVSDTSGEEFNVVYNLTNNTVDGRPSAEARHAPFVELLESMHKQHHFPANFGATFFWALFADLTALSLIVWALSGLVMWWQLKKLRVYGVGVLALAAVLATLVMTGTARDLSFAPERPNAGP